MEVTNLFEWTSAAGPRVNLEAAVIDGRSIIRVAQIEGTFPRHRHRTDEGWIVLRGSMTIQGDDWQVDLKSGDVCTVPASRWHTSTCRTPGTVVACIHAAGFETEFDEADPPIGGFRVISNANRRFDQMAEDVAERTAGVDDDK